MTEDIVPSLLEAMKRDFKFRYDSNSKIQALLKKLNNKDLSYEEAYDYADELGNLLAQVLKKHISPGQLPDGKMYYNIAQRVMGDALSSNHELVAVYSQAVQTAINKNAGYNIKALKSNLSEDRVDGFIQRLASEEEFDDVSWMLDEPVKTFTRATVDDTLKRNAEFNNQLGIAAVIERTEEYDACSWCKALEGTYTYPDDVPAEVYMRHDNCRGRVLYRPENKRKAQNVHSKEWTRR